MYAYLEHGGGANAEDGIDGVVDLVGLTGDVNASGL